MSEQLEKYNKVTSDQKETYSNKMEYMGEVGKFREQVRVAFMDFITNPNTNAYNLLETKMMQYQNIQLNCFYKVKE